MLHSNKQKRFVFFKFVKKILQLFFLTSVGYFIYLTFQENWLEIKNQISVLLFCNVLISTIFLTVQMLLSFYAWFLIQQTVSNKQGNLKLFFSVYFSSNLAKYIPGGIWDHVGKFTLLKKYSSYSQPEITKGIYIFLLYTVLTAGIFFLPLLALTLSFRHLFVIFITSLLLTIILYRSSNKLSKFFAQYKTLSFLFSAVRFAYIKPFLIILLSWIFYGLSLYFLLSSNTFISIIQSIRILLVAPAAWVAGFVFPLAPNGIGVRESIIYFFLSNNFSHSAILAALLVFRIFSILIDIILGIASILILNIVYRNTENRKSDS